jgi:hypothetical protein
MVSESSALIRVDVPQVSGAAPAKITVAGTDVTSQFKTAADGSLQGVVSGLSDGKNTISVSFNGTTTDLTVVSHGRNGPIISGPHQMPWICQTTDFVLPDGSNLGTAQDADCNAPTKVQYIYMPQTGTAFKPMTSTSAVPPDARTTTTTDGHVVNYIVRLETGTLNRGIYQFAVLFDPTKESAPAPNATYQGWNRKIVFPYGGSGFAGYVQGKTTGGVVNDLWLSKGFAVISSSLTVLGNNENDVLAAESTSMTKEKFIKTFGTPIYTMGWGGSGGWIEQHLTANNYPGLLDGVVPSMSFPDFMSVAATVVDCSLMTRAFAQSGLTWTDAQKAAVSGYSNYSTCTGTTPVNFSSLGWEGIYSPAFMVAKQLPQLLLGVFDVSNCQLTVPAALTYDPITNPTGARCDLFSASVNELGIDPLTGYASRPVDNIGVQYGWQAFHAGVITAEQFVVLNELVGGYDSDGNFRPGRTLASIGGLEAAYAYGRINQVKNLANVPIIDYRNYQDPDIHNAVRSMVTRARLIRANGSADNQVILRAQGAGTAALPGIALDAMDRWLSSIVLDTKSYASQAAKVVANKPSDVVDACYMTTGTKIAEPADINNGGQCGALYPFYSGPHMAAGGPLTDDVLKCQLKPIQRADYPGMTDAQFTRLQAVFTTGVCDYSKPSVGQQPLKATWLSYPTPGVAEALPSIP